MRVKTLGDTAIIIQEKQETDSFIEAFKLDYGTLKHLHLIVDLSGFNQVKPSELLKFLSLSRTHKQANRSFVIACPGVDLDLIPDELIIVPSLIEAHDIVEMESIERDLGL